MKVLYKVVIAFLCVFGVLLIPTNCLAQSRALNSGEQIKKVDDKKVVQPVLEKEKVQQNTLEKKNSHPPVNVEKESVKMRTSSKSLLHREEKSVEIKKE